MGTTLTDTADPVERPAHWNDNSICTACEHERTAPRFRLAVWVAQRLGTHPPRARCEYEQSSVESEVGLPGPCGCTDVFHAA